MVRVSGEGAGHRLPNFDGRVEAYNPPQHAKPKAAELKYLLDFQMALYNAPPTAEMIYKFSILSLIRVADYPQHRNQR